MMGYQFISVKTSGCNFENQYNKYVYVYNNIMTSLESVSRQRTMYVLSALDPPPTNTKNDLFKDNYVFL